MNRKKFFKKGGIFLGGSILGVGIISNILSSTPNLKLLGKFRMYNPLTMLPQDHYTYKDQFGNLHKKIKHIKVKYPYSVQLYNPINFKVIYMLVDKDINNNITKTILNISEHEKYKKRGLRSY